MAIHIDYDREENKIELILDSQGNVISTLVFTHVTLQMVAILNPSKLYKLNWGFLYTFAPIT